MQCKLLRNVLLAARRVKTGCVKLRVVIFTFAKSRWQMRFEVHLLWHLDNLVLLGKVKLGTVKWSVFKYCCHFTVLFKPPDVFKCFSASQNVQLFFQALRDLFDSMDKTSSSIPPIILLQFLHMAFPQFAEKGDQGQYLQQVKSDY